MTILIPRQPDADPASKRTEPTASWLAVRSLHAGHRPQIEQHLLELGLHDRYLRFGYAASDAHVTRYVEHLNFERDEVFGIFSRRLRLVAMAHLAFADADGGARTTAEFGVSVLPRLRGRGVGARLFASACLHARNRGVDTLVVHALTENMAMLRIALAAGATLEHEGSDSTARLKLPPEDIGSHLSQLLEVQTGEIDYGLKAHAWRMDRLLHAVLGLADSR
jgi:RimJ/RimL family protein N-acetyltransferase